MYSDIYEKESSNVVDNSFVKHVVFLGVMAVWCSAESKTEST